MNKLEYSDEILFLPSGAKRFFISFDEIYTIRKRI
jgi:hypothetical protein